MFGVGKTYTYQFPPEDTSRRHFSVWRCGKTVCGIKSLALTGGCPGGAECSVAADWNGDDVCCDDGTYCGPGGSLTGSISYDLLNLIKKENVREFLEDEAYAGSMLLNWDIYSPRNRRAWQPLQSLANSRLIGPSSSGGGVYRKLMSRLPLSKPRRTGLTLRQVSTAEGAC